MVENQKENEKDEVSETQEQESEAEVTAFPVSIKVLGERTVIPIQVSYTKLFTTDFLGDCIR